MKKYIWFAAALILVASVLPACNMQTSSTPAPREGFDVVVTARIYHTHQGGVGFDFGDGVEVDLVSTTGDIPETKVFANGNFIGNFTSSRIPLPLFGKVENAKVEICGQSVELTGQSATSNIHCEDEYKPSGVAYIAKPGHEASEPKNGLVQDQMSIGADWSQGVVTISLSRNTSQLDHAYGLACRQPGEQPKQVVPGTFSVGENSVKVACQTSLEWQFTIDGKIMADGKGGNINQPSGLIYLP